MNVYDFDGTILHGDSEHYFYKYICTLYPRATRYKRKINRLKRKYALGKIEREVIYNYKYQKILKYIDNLDSFLQSFWDEHEQYIKKWYLDNHKDDDVIISATPEFILKPIIERLKVKNIIATNLDLKTRQVVGKLCYKEEKVNRFKQLFNIEDIDNFYSDSITDKYMAEIAKNAYFVKENIITSWDEANKNE